MMGMGWWWIILIVVLVVAAVFMMRPRGGGAPGGTTPQRETPLQTLERRYAAGEISTEDYEERKARL